MNNQFDKHIQSMTPRQLIAVADLLSDHARAELREQRDLLDLAASKIAEKEEMRMDAIETATRSPSEDEMRARLDAEEAASCNPSENQY